MNNNNAKIPEYYSYLTWYDLSSIDGLYHFVQTMIDDGVNLDKYVEIKVYYDILCKNAVTNEPDIMTVDYCVKKLRNALIRYEFAHTTRIMDEYEYYYYWCSDDRK